MKNTLLIFSLFCFITVNAQTSVFNGLLQKYVDYKGNVDYKGLKTEEAVLDTYLKYLSKTNPNNGSNNKQKALWINAYNAYTLKLILEHYPIKSILKIEKDKKKAWKIPFAKVGGKTYTLDYIEHQILRKKLFDPRIHVGVNCASSSCPKLHNKAFTEKNINTELEKLMIAFINNPNKNKLNQKNTIHLSEILNWFKKDFTQKGTVIDYVNKYAKTKVSSQVKIHYLPYSWDLNQK